MNATQPLFIHYVFNMSRAIEFYRQVFDVELLSESPGWSTLDCGSFELALHILSPQHQTENPIPPRWFESASRQYRSDAKSDRNTRWKTDRAARA